MHRFPERIGIAVGGVGQHDRAGEAVMDGALDHPEGQVDLRLVDDFVGDACLPSSRRIVGPALRKVQLEVDRKVVITARDTEAYSNLAIGGLAGGTGVLPLNANGV